MPTSAPEPLTILSDGKSTTVPQRPPAAGDASDDVWLPLSTLPRATGWELKPEGLCRDDVCVPVPPAAGQTLLREDGGQTWLSLAALGRQVGQPHAYDRERRVWSLGPPAYTWQHPRGTGPAPDFTLPDVAGHSRSLSDYRGTKVFLVTWASW
jgi:hypothetical protein